MSGQLGDVQADEYMRASQRDRVIDILGALPVTPAFRRQLLIEWARMVGTKLHAGELERVGGGKNDG